MTITGISEEDDDVCRAACRCSIAKTITTIHCEGVSILVSCRKGNMMLHERICWHASDASASRHQPSRCSTDDAKHKLPFNTYSEELDFGIPIHIFAVGHSLCAIAGSVVALQFLNVK